MINGSDDSFMFGDNFSVVKFNDMPAGKLKFPSHIIKYHCTREAQVKGIIKFLHMNGNDNLVDIVTNIRSSNTWFPLTNPLLFWGDMEFLQVRVVAEGSANS